MTLAYWLNTAWMAKCASEAWAFDRATRRVAATQADVLRRTLRASADTEFGRRHGFADLRSARDYLQRVPLSRYEDYADAIARIAAGRPAVLTGERVELLEPTSGTSGGEKLIPCTAGLRRQFQRAVAAWVFDLFRRRPALRRGRAYWSLSPAHGPPRRTPGGVPVGFQADAEYLGGWERFALERLLVAPAALARLGDIVTFRYGTLLCLLRAADLALVSVWNPTFLTALLEPLEPWWDRLVHDVRHGTFTSPAGHAALQSSADPARARELDAIARRETSWPDRLRAAWPRLGLISCWADAAAARFLPELRALFPAVEVQPKGLLATEGCVSFPLVGRPAPVLAVRSHFFEFQAADEPACRLAHELQEGGRYRVILTTAGGLYRYQLRDEVQVVGFENACPLLRFQGKADLVSDLVGEKLGEPHARAVLDRLFAERGLAPRFALLAPLPMRPPRYGLFVQMPPGPMARLTPEELGRALETALRENPHYGYAVRLGQLGPATVVALDPAGPPAWQTVERHHVRQGRKVGDIKPLALDRWNGWAETFQSQGPRPLP